MEKLKEIIEKLGWKIYEEDYAGGETGWDIRQISPAGEDFGFTICHNNDVATAIKEITQYAECFDEEEHVEMLLAYAKHNRPSGMPGIKELVEDAEEIQNMLNELSNYLFNHVRVCSECGKIMQEGYVIGGTLEYYCSDECLHKHYTKEEWNEMYTDDGDNYYTSWEE